MDRIENIPYPREPTVVQDASCAHPLNGRVASDYPSATRRSCTFRTRTVLMLPTRAVTSRETLQRDDHANEHVRPTQPVKTGNLLVSTNYDGRTVMIRATGHNMDGVEVFSLGYSEETDKLEAKCLSWKGVSGRRKTLWLSDNSTIGSKRTIKRCPTCRLRAFQCRRVDAPGHLKSCDSIVDIQLCKALSTSLILHFLVRTKHDFVYYCSISTPKPAKKILSKSPLKSNPGESYELYIQKRREQQALLASTIGNRNEDSDTNSDVSDCSSDSNSDEDNDSTSSRSSVGDSGPGSSSSSSSSGSDGSGAIDPIPDKTFSVKHPVNHYVINFDDSLALKYVGSFHFKVASLDQQYANGSDGRHVYAMITSPYSVGYIAVVYCTGNVVMYDMTKRASATMPHLVGEVNCKGIIEDRDISAYYNDSLCASFGYHPLDILLGRANRVYCARVQQAYAEGDVASPKGVFVLPRRDDRRQNESITNIQLAKQHFHIVVGTSYSIYVVDVRLT